MSMKNSSDTIGNRTCDLPTCNTVPQPTPIAYPITSAGLYRIAFYRLEEKRPLGGRKRRNAMEVDFKMAEYKIVDRLRLAQYRAQNNRLIMDSDKKNRKQIENVMRITTVFIKHHSQMIYGYVEIQFHSFVNFAHG